MARLWINMIRVGTDQFTTNDVFEMAKAVQYLQNRFAYVGIFVDEVRYPDTGLPIPWGIATDETGGLHILDYDEEAKLLTSIWTIENWAIDVFVVKWFDIQRTGLSPINGPTDKFRLYPEMSGVVLEICPPYTGQTLAHEVGHYLGLEHRQSDPNNLMFDPMPNGGQLDSIQGVTMRSHPFVFPDFP